MSFNLIDTINNSKVFHNYFDIPLQHISNKMLKTMKRGMKADKIKEILDYIFKLDNVFFRTSFIVGHPEEEDEDFNELYDFIQKYDFDRVSIFAYSDEEGTGAYNFKNKVPSSLMHQRIEQIEKLIDVKINKSMKKILNTNINISIKGVSEEHEYFMSAKQDLWGFDIDGEILINDKEIDDELEIGKSYKAKVSDYKNMQLIAKVIK